MSETVWTCRPVDDPTEQQMPFLLGTSLDGQDIAIGTWATVVTAVGDTGVGAPATAVKLAPVPGVELLLEPELAEAEALALLRAAKAARAAREVDRG